MIYRIYGIKVTGEEEKFRFEFTDKYDANKKAQELRNIISGVRYNVNHNSKYRDIVVKEEAV